MSNLKSRIMDELLQFKRGRNSEEITWLSKRPTLFDTRSKKLTQLGKLETETECIRALIPFIWIFRALGILPIKISSDSSVLSYEKFSGFKVMGVLGGLTQVFLLIESFRKFVHLAALSSSDSVQVVDYANTIIYYGHVLAVTLIMRAKVKLFPKFIDACKTVETMCKRYVPDPTDKLIKRSWLIFGLIFGSQLFGEVLYYNRIANSNNATASLDEFLASLDSTALFPVENSKLVGAFTFIAELYCDIEWTFGEHLISISGYIITQYFIRLNHGISSCNKKSVAEIEQLRCDHRSLKDLVEIYNSIFSPILLVTYIGNLGSLLTRLYVGVAKDLGDKNVAVLIESLYAFSYLIAKIFLPTWFAAILNETAHESLDTVHDWPSSIGSEDCKYRIMVINRFVSQLATDPVHFNGCGYFTLTKNFIVTLISGIIGYEVIILQFQQAAGVVK